MSENEIVLRLKKEEVTLLANALNEARESVEEWEFQTRLGSPREAAEGLRQRLLDALVGF